MSAAARSCPRYLGEFEATWKRDPRAANLAWFRQAESGLFLHYGLYSQLGSHEWVMFREKIHPDDVTVLRAVGERIRREGYPAPNPEVVPQRYGRATPA